MNPAAVVIHPIRVFAEVAARPRLAMAAVVVALSGAVSGGIAAAATSVAGGGASGYVVAGLLPALFLAFWLLEGWLVDAGAGMVEQAGRRRTLLATTAYAFPAWTAYALLSLVEALALRGGGADLASALAWVTLPVLAWFVTLTVLAVRQVYDMSPLTALALALLPYAVLMAALLVLTIVLGVLHAAHVI